MKELVCAIRAGALGDLKVALDGAPVTPESAARIGADGCASSAAVAVDLVKQLVHRWGTAAGSRGRAGQPG